MRRVTHPTSLPAESIPHQRAALRAWFAARGRQLVFRERAEPWGVLVSEVMAQQTQISRVEPAWAAFMTAFPTPAALAEASPAAVLRAWAGMGYNRRALNLQRAAAVIMERHGGELPRTLAELEALPGVGPYTARAVAAIAFGMPVAALDTNVRRVVGRVVGGHGATADPGTALPPKVLQAFADAIVDPADPAVWTHATMDLGATVCRPMNPRCEACPLTAWCVWRSTTADAAAEGVPSPPRRRDRAAHPGSERGRAPGASFPFTRRWLRGRIVALLREMPDGAWLTLDGPMGLHGQAAVEAAIAGLAGEGMLELRPDGAVRLPSARR